jgi:hypothetical protein
MFINDTSLVNNSTNIRCYQRYVFGKQLDKWNSCTRDAWGYIAHGKRGTESQNVHLKTSRYTCPSGKPIGVDDQCCRPPLGRFKSVWLVFLELDVPRSHKPLWHAPGSRSLQGCRELSTKTQDRGP